MREGTRTEVRISVPHEGGGQSKTKQADKDSTDVNKIVGRYVNQGVPLPVDSRPPAYGDFTESIDFHTALSRVRQCEQDFMELPAYVRKVCENDPGVFFDLLQTDEGVEELMKAGMPAERLPAEPQEEPPAEPAEERTEDPAAPEA